MSLLGRHENALAALQARGRHRALSPRAGHDFASNDYLGLAGSDFLATAALRALSQGVPVGAGGSRLLRGNDDAHSRLERFAATFFGTEAALFMGGGFQANTAIFSTLPGHEDLVLYDARIHASAHDGMRLGRAKTQSFAHNDIAAARQAAANWSGGGRIWIAIESLYSMDGDFAPVAEFVALAEELDAMLVIDEAHATGVLGDHGRGLSHAFASTPRVLALHTCGKGLGVSGALITGASTLIETLINKARSFIFATAPSPLNAALVEAALRELQASSARQDTLASLVAHAHAEAARLCGLSGFESQIMPVIIGADKPTMALANRLQNAGYDIRGIRPPTVPRHTSRLRISITLNVTAKTVTQAFEDLAREMEREAA